MLKRKTASLRTQLTLLMVLLVLLQSFSLVMSLSISNVFLMLDAEAFRLFGSTSSARAKAVDGDIGMLVSNVAQKADDVGTAFAGVAKEFGTGAENLYQTDEAYEKAALLGSETLMSLLLGDNITGAFFLLNGSNANKQDASAHSAVYIRSASPGAAGGQSGSYWLEAGPSLVAQKNQIASSVNWDLDIVLDKQNESLAGFYTQPILAAAELERSEMERYGYWAPPADILGDGQDVVVYSVPLLNEEGEAFGVMGVEISLPYFTQHYLPNIELPYENSFYAIVPTSNTEMALDWYIPSGPIAQVYLKQGETLPLEGVKGDSGLFETRLPGLGDMYCSLHPLTMYSKNSPFAQDGWSLVGFVPKTAMHEGSSGVRFLLIASITGTTLLSFGAIFLLVYLATRKISGLSQYVETLSPYQDICFQPTGMREIDELTSAVERLNKSAISAANSTSRILELTQLSIGGFELSSENDQVILTEFVYELLGLEVGSPVNREQWADIYSRLTALPAEGFEDTYQYEDKATGLSHWLRVIETPIAGGKVGVIQEVTRDVEYNRRLAYELDHDPLTRLYNRNSFKREVEAKITAEPEKVGAMIFADLDNLKYMNDTFGHDMGDRLIVRAGEMFREFNFMGGVTARISGDEFAVYLHGFATKEEARELIHGQYKRNEAFTLPVPGNTAQRVRCSSGIAWYPEDANEVGELLKLADYAMYEAKHTNKGAIFEFSQQSYHKNAYLLENREAINRLLDEELIRFAFQPIVCLKTGAIYAYEALMRPLLENFRSPLEILNVAAAQSKLYNLEKMIIFKVLGELTECLAELGGAKLFINSIPSQLLSDSEHEEMNRRFGKVFPHVVVEITEAENDSPQQLERKVAYIHSSGMQLAIDDFGSGYSNEIRILSMQPDVVKLDIELIRGIHQSPDRQQLVANLISFCHPRGIKLIAEGVEEVEDLAEVIRLGVDFVQGYYTGRPAFQFAPLEERVQREILALQPKGEG